MPRPSSKRKHYPSKHSASNKRKASGSKKPASKKRASSKIRVRRPSPLKGRKLKPRVGGTRKGIRGGRYEEVKGKNGKIRKYYKAPPASTHSRSRPSSGWKEAAPKKGPERREMLARCGRKAFLDPDHLKYPVIAYGKSCKIDPRGVLAADRRADQYHHPRLAAKARQIAKKKRFSWAA